MRYGLAIFTVFLALLALQSGSVYSEPLTPENNLVFVGVDETGQPLEVQVSSQQLKNQLAKAVSQVEAGGLQAIESQRATNTNEWKLREVLVGLGVKIKVGWDKIINADIVPGFRLVLRPLSSSQGR